MVLQDINNNDEHKYKKLQKKCNKVSLSSILFIVLLCFIVYLVFRSDNKDHGHVTSFGSNYSFDSPIYNLRKLH
jgi:hypothetical protein